MPGSAILLILCTLVVAGGQWPTVRNVEPRLFRVPGGLHRGSLHEVWATEGDGIEPCVVFPKI